MSKSCMCFTPRKYTTRHYGMIYKYSFKPLRRLISKNIFVLWFYGQPLNYMYDSEKKPDILCYSIISNVFLSLFSSRAIEWYQKCSIMAPPCCPKAENFKILMNNNIHYHMFVLWEVVSHL